jgi:hypothetical protein
MCRAIGASARVASADSSIRHFGWTFKGPRALRPLTPGATANPELWLCAICLWTLREGSSGGRRPDFPARPKSIGQQQHQRFTTPDKSKRKTRRREPLGPRARDLRPPPCCQRCLSIALGILPAPTSFSCCSCAPIVHRPAATDRRRNLNVGAGFRRLGTQPPPKVCRA